MARADIEKMISEALGEEPVDEYRPPPRRPLPHGQHILNQYAKLCHEPDAHRPDPSADIELPLPPADPAPQPSSPKKKLASVMAKFARAKR